MKTITGKRVVVKVNDAGRRRLNSDLETISGYIDADVDWLIGCPVFRCELGALGVGYECSVIEILEDDENESNN